MAAPDSVVGRERMPCPSSQGVMSAAQFAGLESLRRD